MKKILIISHSANLYGSEKSLLDALIQLKSSPQFVFEIWLPTDGPLVNRLRSAGFGVKIYSYKRWINQGKAWANVFHYLMNVMALFFSIPAFIKFKPDLIYSNSLTNPFGLYLARLHKVKHIWHIREFIEEDIGARFDFNKSKCMQLAGRYTNLFICNSLAISHKWNKYSTRPFKVIYNGFNFDSGLDIEAGIVSRSNREVFKLLVASSIQPGKGIQDVLDVMTVFKKFKQPITLTIIGSVEDKVYYLKMREFCEKEGLEDCVEWKGYTKNLIQEFDLYSAIVIPSRCEAFGRIAVEAMGAGLPVIATEAGGLVEIIDHEETGLLYAPSDIVALEACVARIQNQPNFVSKIVKSAYQSVINRFSMHLYIEELTQTFNVVLNSEHD